MIWRTITDAKGNPISVEEITSTLLFPVQLYIDPLFHLERTLDSFGVSSWEELQAASSKWLPIKDEAGVTYCLQAAI